MENIIDNELQMKHNDTDLPEQSIVYHKFLFNTRKQETGESFRDFASSLQILSNDCHYDADEVLIHSLIRDRFIAGLRDSTIQLEIFNLSHQRSIRKNEYNKTETKDKNDNLSLDDAVNLACMIQEGIESQYNIKLEQNDSEFPPNREGCGFSLNYSL